MIKNDLIQIRKTLSKLLFKFAEITSTEGVIVIYDGELVEGISGYTYDKDGAKVALPNGIYNLTLEDGKKVVIESVDGVIASIKSIVEESVDESTEDVSLDMNVELAKIRTENENTNSKVNSLIEAMTKMNEALLSFGSEESIDIKKTIKIEDKVDNKVSASKYFV